MLRVLRCNRGATAVEFALTVSIFLTLLLGIIEFSRLMMLWGTASEATRMAARMGSLCSPGPVTEQAIRNRITPLLEASGQVSLAGRTGWLTLSYTPAGCTEANCTMVTAKLSGLSVQLDIPGPARSVTLPDFSATAPREAMLSTILNTANDACL